MQIQPYLSFEGRCDEAVEFYRSALGAEVQMLMRFKDTPDPSMATSASADKIAHVALRIGDSTVMASDGRCTGKPTFSGVTMSLSMDDDADAERRFNALGQDGQVNMPLAKTFFASKFGMLTDKFGVSWMVLSGPQGGKQT